MQDSLHTDELLPSSTCLFKNQDGLTCRIKADLPEQPILPTFLFTDQYFGTLVAGHLSLDVLCGPVESQLSPTDSGDPSCVYLHGSLSNK